MLSLVLWLVMLGFAVASWFVQRPGKPILLRTGLAIIHAVFIVWVILTSIQLVGPVWMIVAVILGMPVLFRADLERLWQRG